MITRNLGIVFLLLLSMLEIGIAKAEKPQERKDTNPLTISISAKDTNCPNDPKGSATVTASGGQMPYSYSWSTGATTATISDLRAGGYFVTVTDAKGAQKNTFIEVQASNRMVLTFDQSTIACAYETDGKVVAQPQGGLAPYTYLWHNGSTKPYLENIGQGMYMVTVTDANGCRAEEGIMVMVPDPLRIKAHVAHVSCGAEADGFMEVEAEGGTAPYTYVWELDGQGGDRREDLKPGLYSVTVTDANGCTAMICPELINSKPPILVGTPHPETCPGEGDGSATVTPSGDSPPYFYQWSDNVKRSNHSTAFDLTAGTYSVTVTNFRGCSSSIDIEVGQAGGGFGFVVETNGASCGTGANGYANVRITGGVPPFIYSWTDESTNSIISNSDKLSDLVAGNYEVRVSDANGCFGQKDVLIVEKPVPTIAASPVIGKVCFGEKTGSARATAMGGEGDLTYKWSNDQTGATATALGGGEHGVTVTDANGCQASTTVLIEESSKIIIQEIVTDLICYRTAGGEIIANATGGTGSYTYQWSNNATTDRISDILAGTYFVTVTDSEGCQAIKGITIGQPTEIALSVSTTNAADMNSFDGGASVEVSGGTAPYSYSWNTGATTRSIANVSAGTYSVTVTDNNGCEQATEVVIEATCTLMASITDIRVDNCAGGNGAMTVTTTGAKGAVSYQWTNGATTFGIAGLSPGFYGVTVTDENGCQYASGGFVGDGCDCTQPVLETVLVFESECEKNTGSIDIQVYGDEADFMYSWSDPNLSGTSGKNLATGAYQVTITAKDDTNCSIVETINVGNTNVGPVIVLRNEPEVCNGQKGSVLLLPTDLDYQWSDGGTGSERTDLSAGDYLVTVTIPGSTNCKDLLKVSIDQVSGLTITPQINRHPDCGLSNGAVTINVAGGSGDYTYNWGAASNNNLPSGTYNIEVEDKVTKCTASTLFTLTENVGSMDIAIDSLFPVSCAGSLDGKVFYQLMPTADFAGNPEVIITDGKGKTYNATALPAGDYCIVVKDENGCQAGQKCFTITEPDFLQVDVTVIPKTCSVENTILLNSTGGNGDYTYNWADQNGPINPKDRRGIENGMYSVTVSDVVGCNIPIDNIVLDGECFICALDASATIETIPECGLPNGAVTLNVANFFGNLSYSWGTDSVRTDLVAGTYTVTVTDDYRGCDTTVSFTLTEPDLPMDAKLQPLIVCPAETGQLQYDLANFRCYKQPLSVTITDAANKTYNENALAPASDYIFVVKDADGAAIYQQDFIVESYEPIIKDAQLLDEGCTTLGTIDLELANQETNYTITWEDLAGENQTVDRTDLLEGTYNVTITDNVQGGCSVTSTYTIGKDTAVTASIEPLAFTCDINPLQLTLEGKGFIHYDWQPANLVISGQNTASPMILPDPTQPLMTVKATDAFGCVVEKTVNVVSVNTNPEGGITASPQCDGLTVQFSSQGTTQYYRWDFGDGTFSDEVNPLHTYEKAGDYAVKLILKPDVPCAESKGVLANKAITLVEDAKTIADFQINYDPCQDEGLIRFEDKSSVRPGNITNWNWDFGNGQTSTVQNPSITLTEAEELNIQLSIKTDVGCTDSMMVSRSFEVFNLPKLVDELLICPNVPTELNPNNEQHGVTYAWTPAEYLDDATAQNPIATLVDTVDFKVKITKDGCERITNLRANVPMEQTYSLSRNEAVCDEMARLIFVEAPDNSTIEWSNTTTGNVLSEEAELMVVPGTYQVKLTDNNNCVVTDNVAIRNFAINAAIDNSTNPCEGGDGFLAINNSTNEALTEIQWKEAEGIISVDLTNDSIEVSPESTMNYTVMVENEYNCRDTLNATVAVSDLEQMIIVAERDTIFKGESTSITVMPAGDYSINWSPSGSLQSMSGFDQIATPEETTTYTVTITDNQTNCVLTRQVTIFVKEVMCGKPNIFVPNAFSPNGDGFNDILYVRGNAITTLYFAVYNRWGEKVFETEAQDIGWDGTYKGEVVSTDVYAYHLRVTCVDGETYEVQGNVTVLN